MQCLLIANDVIHPLGFLFFTVFVINKVIIIIIIIIITTTTIIEILAINNIKYS